MSCEQVWYVFYSLSTFHSKYTETLGRSGNPQGGTGLDSEVTMVPCPRELFYLLPSHGIRNKYLLWCTRLRGFPGGTQFSSLQSFSRVQLFVTPWIAARQASLSVTNSRSLLKLMSIESVMPSSHLILCRPLFLLPPIPPSIRVFSNESTLRMRWPKYWSFSFSISPSNEHPGLISFRMDWLDLLAVLSRVFSNTTVQKHQFFSTQLSSQSNSHIHTWPLEKP